VEDGGSYEREKRHLPASIVWEIAFASLFTITLFPFLSIKSLGDFSHHAPTKKESPLYKSLIFLNAKKHTIINALLKQQLIERYPDGSQRMRSDADIFEDEGK